MLDLGTPKGLESRGHDGRRSERSSRLHGDDGNGVGKEPPVSRTPRFEGESGGEGNSQIA